MHDMRRRAEDELTLRRARADHYRVRKAHVQVGVGRNGGGGGLVVVHVGVTLRDEHRLRRHGEQAHCAIRTARGGAPPIWGQGERQDRRGVRIVDRERGAKLAVRRQSPDAHNGRVTSSGDDTGGQCSDRVQLVNGGVGAYPVGDDGRGGIRDGEAAVKADGHDMGIFVGKSETCHKALMRAALQRGVGRGLQAVQEDGTGRISKREHGGVMVERGGNDSGRRMQDGEQGARIRMHADGWTGENREAAGRRGIGLDGRGRSGEGDDGGGGQVGRGGMDTGKCGRVKMADGWTVLIRHGDEVLGHVQVACRLQDVRRGQDGRVPLSQCGVGAQPGQMVM